MESPVCRQCAHAIHARQAIILEALQYVEEKHVPHVLFFHVLRKFRAKAAGTTTTFAARRAYGVVSTCGGCTYLHGVEAGAALLTTEPD
jgi:hypothetical protein